MIDQLTQRQGKQVKRDLFKTVVTDREGKALAKGKERERQMRDRNRDTKSKRYGQTDLERISQGCLDLRPCILPPANMVSALTPEQEAS